MRLLKEIRNLLGNYHVKSGIYHYYRNEYKQAVDFFMKALESDEVLTDTDRKTANYYLTLSFMESAERHENRDEMEDAVRDYERGIKVSPDYPDIHLRLGRVLEQIGRIEGSLEEYGRAIECNRDYLDAWVAKGFLLLQEHRNTEAEDALRHACDIKVRQTRDPFEAGAKLLRDSKDADAEQHLRLAFLHIPQLFDEHYRAAVSLLKAEDYENALERLNAAIALHPHYPDLYNFRGIALYELSRQEDSVDDFRRSYELNPGFTVARLNLAFALAAAGRYKESEAELEGILKDDPDERAAAAKLEELQSERSPEKGIKRRSTSRGTAR